MAAFDRRTLVGGAVATTLTGSMDSSVLLASIDATSGWPTGSAGEWGIVIGRGTATEEKVLVTSRSGAVLTLASGGRGIDGTTAMSHAVGDTVEVCLLARDLDEANSHIADTAYDHHTQYLNSTRHDVEARHTFGAAYGTPAAAADISTAAATGTGNNPAREDHVHKIGAGAINSSGMFAAGVVAAAAIADDAVGVDELAAASVVAASTVAEAWTDWTPTYANLTVGNGTVVARYMKRGRDVVARFSIVFGTTTSMSTTATIGLPFAAHASGYGTGAASAFDASALNPYSGIVVHAPGASTLSVFLGETTLSPTTPFTWTTNDIFTFTITYEAAA